MQAILTGRTDQGVRLPFVAASSTFVMPSEASGPRTQTTLVITLGPDPSLTLRTTEGTHRPPRRLNRTQ